MDRMGTMILASLLHTFPNPNPKHNPKFCQVMVLQRRRQFCCCCRRRYYCEATKLQLESVLVPTTTLNLSIGTRTPQSCSSYTNAAADANGNSLLLLLLLKRSRSSSNKQKQEKKKKKPRLHKIEVKGEAAGAAVGDREIAITSQIICLRRFCCRLGFSLEHLLKWIIGYIILFLFTMNCTAEATYEHSSTSVNELHACEHVSKYYKNLRGLKGKELMMQLHRIIAPHHSLHYSQVWSALKVLDADDMVHPESSKNVIEIYSLRSAAKTLAGKAEGWNREHLWPRSYGLHKEPEVSDLHNLRPADVNVNSSRGNRYYEDCPTTRKQCITPANQEAAPDTSKDKTSWMPPAEVKGDIARAVMYMAVRYGYDQPIGRCNLHLSDSPNMKKCQMGLLSSLLQWNEKDPPSIAERKRNDLVCKLYQYNRNPFVDHPEYASLIWGHAQ